jgi:ubiquinone/menaquinone biosynthesis C-methylase UbiE
MERTYGVERLLAVHPTTVEPWEWQTLTRQWNNLWTKCLSRHYDDYLLVPEYSPDERLHAHVVLVAKRDIRTGYDFAAREVAKKRGPKARWRSGANTCLKEEMKRWDSGKFDKEERRWTGKGVQLPYRFGYTRVEPVKNAVGFARYMAKYMTKGFEHRRPEDKGRRLIRCSQRIAKIRAPRVGVGVSLWDAKLASFLALNGLPNAAGLREKVGGRWAWYLRDVIWGTPLHEYHDIEWDDIGGKHVTIPGTRVAVRDGEEIPRVWAGLGTVKFTNNSVVKSACLNGWNYQFERRHSEEIMWESDGTRRFVLEGPQVSEFGPERNGLVVRPGWRFNSIAALGLEFIPDFVQASLALDDSIRFGPTRAEVRKEGWRRMLRSIEENPFWILSEMQIPDYVASYKASLASYIATYGREKAMELIVGGQFNEIGILESSALLTLGLRSDDCLVDVGCGSGRLAFALRRFLTGKFIGTDILDEALNYAREKVGRPDWDFLETFEPVIPIPDQKANMVSFFSVFTHLLDEDIFRFLAEAKRVTKSGGKIVFSFLDFEVPSHWTVFENTLADKNPKRVLNKFIGKAAIIRWAKALSLDIERLYDGSEAWIELTEEFKYSDGRLAAGIVEFGQSVGVIRVP